MIKSIWCGEMTLQVRAMEIHLRTSLASIYSRARNKNVKRRAVESPPQVINLNLMAMCCFSRIVSPVLEQQQSSVFAYIYIRARRVEESPARENRNAAKSDNYASSCPAFLIVRCKCPPPTPPPTRRRCISSFNAG